MNSFEKIKEKVWNVKEKLWNLKDTVKDKFQKEQEEIQKYNEEMENLSIKKTAEELAVIKEANTKEINLELDNQTKEQILKLENLNKDLELRILDLEEKWEKNREIAKVRIEEVLIIFSALKVKNKEKFEKMLLEDIQKLADLTDLKNINLFEYYKDNFMNLSITLWDWKATTEANKLRTKVGKVYRDKELKEIGMQTPDDMTKTITENEKIIITLKEEIEDNKRLITVLDPSRYVQEIVA